MDAAAVTHTANGWTTERVDAARACVVWLADIEAQLGDCLDQAHDAGLFIPPAVADAAPAVTPLRHAWASNAAGEPAPAFARAALGLGAAPQAPRTPGPAQPG